MEVFLKVVLEPYPNGKWSKGKLSPKLVISFLHIVNLELGTFMVPIQYNM